MDEREIKSLLGDRLRVKRNRDQVMVVLGHRVGCGFPLLSMGGIGTLTCGEIDVDETLKKVRKEVDALEEKLMQVVAVEEESKTEEGTSVMDIQEELDDEGNVLSECLARCGEGTKR